MTTDDRKTERLVGIILTSDPADLADLAERADKLGLPRLADAFDSELEARAQGVQRAPMARTRPKAHPLCKEFTSPDFLNSMSALSVLADRIEPLYAKTETGSDSIVQSKRFLDTAADRLPVEVCGAEGGINLAPIHKTMRAILAHADFLIPLAESADVGKGYLKMAGDARRDLKTILGKLSGEGPGVAANDSSVGLVHFGPNFHISMNALVQLIEAVARSRWEKSSWLGTRLHGWPQEDIREYNRLKKDIENLARSISKMSTRWDKVGKQALQKLLIDVRSRAKVFVAVQAEVAAKEDPQVKKLLPLAKEALRQLGKIHYDWFAQTTGVQPADDPERGLLGAPTPALEDIPTETGPSSEPMPLSTREPLSGVPTIDDVMEAIKEQTPIDPEELKGMDKAVLELLRTRLGIVMNVVEKALGHEPTPLLSPEEQAKHEEGEVLRGTIGRAGSFLLSKRADDDSIALAIRRFPEDASGPAALLKPLFDKASRACPALKAEAEPLAEQLMSSLPDDKNLLHELDQAAFATYLMLSSAGSGPINKLYHAAQKKGWKIEENEKVEQGKADMEKLRPIAADLIAKLEPFSKGEAWHEEPALTIKRLRGKLEEDYSNPWEARKLYQVRPHQLKWKIKEGLELLKKLKEEEAAGR